MSILIAAFSITGVMLYYLLGNFVVQEKVDSLKQTGESISNLFNSLISNYNNPFAHLLFKNNIEYYSKSSKALIWIVEKEGHILISSPEFPDEVRSAYADETGYVKLPDEKQYQKVFSGTEPVIETGNFYGFFNLPDYSIEGDSWLTIESPFDFMSKTADGKISKESFAIFIHTPVPEIQKVRITVFKFFIISVVIAVFISLIITYIFSHRLSRPLKQISNAARQIGGGEFSRKLDIKSRDEIGELAATFNQMVVALQNLENMRRDFIANVSHELRTPMTSINGFVEGILDGTIPQEKHNEYLSIVKEEAMRLSRLVSDLLDLAKMQSGDISLNIAPFNINELIRRCVIKLEHLIVEKDLRIEAVFEEKDIIANADKDSIERVILNLIHNAVKFSPQGGTITIGAVIEKNNVLFSLKDEGQGIAKEELDFIWERFYKSDKSRSLDKTGTGLGLAIVKNIVMAHGREIHAESTIGKGSRFWFTLPILPD